MNYWKDIPLGKKPPELLNAVIEVVSGSRDKYEYKSEWEAFVLDRMIPSSVVFPVEYGFVPQTWYDDEDPLDIMVLSYEPLEVGCIVRVRVIGALIIEDEKGVDSKILSVLADDVDMVNGYKISRNDPLHRIIIGRIYQHFVRFAFGLKLRDPDCDFRVMRRSIFERVKLESDTGVICVEMMKKIGDNNFRIAEVPVHHYHRAYGHSQFFNFKRLFWVAIALTKLWFRLVVRKEHLTEPIAPAARTPSQ